MSFIIWTVIGLTLWHFVNRPAKPQAPRLVNRSPELHAQIVAAHKAQHEAVVNGAWTVDWNKPAPKKVASNPLDWYRPVSKT